MYERLHVYHFVADLGEIVNISVGGGAFTLITSSIFSQQQQYPLILCSSPRRPFAVDRMAPRRLGHPLFPAALLLSCAFSSAWAQTQFKCLVTIGDLKYDLTPLDKEYTLNRDRDTPPTKWRDTVRFNLCSDLKQLDGVAAEDQVRVRLLFNGCIY